MTCISRRRFVSLASSGVAAAQTSPAAKAATVAVARCKSYGPELVSALDRMFDQIGGLGRIVKGRTVAIKLNLTGLPTTRLGSRPIGMAQWVHPAVIGAVLHLMDRAGAHRIRLLEGGASTADPLDEYMYQAGWDPSEFLSAAKRVEFENTNWLGSGKDYPLLKVPDGGALFPAYLANHSYTECDAFVSLGKMKDHVTTGVTLSMKNVFGILPCTIYGDRAPEDAPSDLPFGGRDRVFHQGARQPAKPAPRELDPKSPRHEGYRLPRVVVDLCAARPIDLAVVDGVETMGGGEGPWFGGAPCSPGILLAGTNCVNTDAVGAAVMGYDPMTPAGKAPFFGCDNFLELAEKAGLGSRNLNNIEVAGAAIASVRYDFAPFVRTRIRSPLLPYPVR